MENLTPVSLKRDSSVLSPPDTMPSEKVQGEVPPWATQLLDNQRQTQTMITDLKASVDFANTQSTAAVTDTQNLKKTVSDLQIENSNLKRDIAMLNQKCASLEQRLNNIENYSRRNNILISGLSENNGEDCNAVAQKMFTEKMQLTIDNQDINVAHRVGTKSEKEGSSRPILVQFNNMNKKNEVMSKTKKLKDTNIYVNQDYCQSTLAARKKLLFIFNNCKRLPHYQYLKLIGERLVIKGKTYTVANLHTLPEDLKPAKLATPARDGVVLFFSENSPLSNFYKREFTVSGEQYSCVEQFLWSKKATVYKDYHALYRIMTSDSPAQMKKTAKQIKSPSGDESEWLEMMPDVMTIAVHAKFAQNPDLKEVLLNTGDDVIAEANPHDTKWGCGFGLLHPDAFKQSKWQGLNELGKILMQVRTDLTD